MRNQGLELKDYEVFIMGEGGCQLPVDEPLSGDEDMEDMAPPEKEGLDLDSPPHDLPPNMTGDLLTIRLFRPDLP